MLPKIKLTVFLFFLSSSFVFSQNNKLDSLFYTLDKSSDNTSEIEILKQIATEISSSAIDSIELIAGNIFKFSEKDNDNLLLSKLHFTIAYTYFLKKDWVMAIKKFLSAQSYIKKNENLELESELLEYMGYAYSKIGLRNKAIFFYESSIEIEKDSLKMGLRYQKLGFFIAMDLLEKLKVREVLDTDLSIINNSQEIKNTLNFLKTALAIGINNKNQQLIKSSYNTIAIIHLLTGNNDKAWDYFQQSLQLNIKRKDTRDIANSYGNLAETAFRMGKHDKSIALWQKSFDYLKNIDDPFMKADHYKGLARVYYAKKDFTKTLFYIEKSIEIEQNYSLDEPLAK
ncbi:MAG: hypothetical protein DRJ10_09780, partial [Bacteroidetes bacterium]